MYMSKYPMRQRLKFRGKTKRSLAEPIGQTPNFASDLVNSLQKLDCRYSVYVVLPPKKNTILTSREVKRFKFRLKLYKKVLALVKQNKYR